MSWKSFIRAQEHIASGYPYLSSLSHYTKHLLKVPHLFNIFLKNIMHDHYPFIFINGRLICNLCSADEIDQIVGTNREL